MKKTDVYVVVDTPKKAKKLKKVLDMFWERTYSKSSIQDCLDNTENVLGFDKEENAFMSGYVNQFKESRTKVSIKELRNILAKEHLKAGDVCLFDDKKGFKSIGVFDKYSEEYKDFLVSKIPNNDVCCYGFHDFIRYATEEEKALLEYNKELEIGKWHTFSWDDTPNYVIGVYLIDKVENDKVWFKYGINVEDNTWSYRDWYSKSHNWRLATTKEVEQALIEEAKRRYKVGDKLSKFEGYYYGNCDFIFHPIFDENCFGILDHGNYYLSSRSKNGFYMRLFENGVWATVIEQNNLSNLKEAFNNGYCVEFYDVKTDTWKRHENPCWNTNLQWRIMVNNGHLVISDVYLLNQIEELKKSIEEIKSNIRQ